MSIISCGKEQTFVVAVVVVLFCSKGGIGINELSLRNQILVQIKYARDNTAIFIISRDGTMLQKSPNS